MSTGASSGGCSTMADASGTTLSDGSCHSCTCHATKHHAHAHAHARACMHAQCMQSKPRLDNLDEVDSPVPEMCAAARHDPIYSS